jgi:adenine-specific DNA-methyltransferase
MKSNPDNDPEEFWTLGDLIVGMTKEQRPNLFFDFVDPGTGRVFNSSPKRVWTYFTDTMKEKLREKSVVFPKNWNGGPMLKKFLNELKKDINPISYWIPNEP